MTSKWRRWVLQASFFIMVTLMFEEVQAETFDISMKNRTFNPDIIRIHIGDTVRWVNTDEEVHLVLSGQELNDKDLGKPLDSGTLMPKQSYKYTFSKTGIYPYLCVIHWMQESQTGLGLGPMKGEIVVEP